MSRRIARTTLLSAAFALAFTASAGVAVAAEKNGKAAESKKAVKSAKESKAKDSTKSAKAPAVVEPVVVTLSHRLDDVRAKNLQTLIDAYNSREKAVQVVLARRNGSEAPSLLNLATRAEATELGQRGAFRPLAAVLSEAKQSTPDSQSLAPEVRSADTDGKGKLTALPLAYSAPVLFWNKALFRKAGLDPENPPRTWQEVQDAAGKLRDVADSDCPYTTSWPAWVHIDNVSARNGGTVMQGNELTINGFVQIKHIAKMASWHKSKYFVTFGHEDQADSHFAKGECGMLTSNSDIYATLRVTPGLDVGVTQLPYYDDVYGTPRPALIDGSSLWVGAGHKRNEYEQAARFVSYLMGNDAQVELVRGVGGLPLTAAAARNAGNKLDKRELAAVQIASNGARGVSKGEEVRTLAANPAVLKIVDEELDAVWADRKPAKEALDTAVSRGNRILRTGSKVRLAM